MCMRNVNTQRSQVQLLVVPAQSKAEPEWLDDAQFIVVLVLRETRHVYYHTTTNAYKKICSASGAGPTK